jgi:hypothetical protein
MGVGAICVAPLLCVPPLASLVAIVAGHLSLREISSSDEGGRGMAISGLVMGYLGIGLALVFAILFVVLPLLGIGGAALLTLPFMGEMGFLPPSRGGW